MEDAGNARGNKRFTTFLHKYQQINSGTFRFFQLGKGKAQKSLPESLPCISGKNVYGIDFIPIRKIGRPEFSETANPHRFFVSRYTTKGKKSILPGSSILDAQKPLGIESRKEWEQFFVKMVLIYRNSNTQFFVPGSHSFKAAENHVV